MDRLDQRVLREMPAYPVKMVRRELLVIPDHKEFKVFRA